MQSLSRQYNGILEAHFIFINVTRVNQVMQGQACISRYQSLWATMAHVKLTVPTCFPLQHFVRWPLITGGLDTPIH